MTHNYSTIDLYAHYNCELSLDYEDKESYHFNIHVPNEKNSDKSAVIPFAKISEVLNKNPNWRVHVAISELIGEEVYNKIKEEL